MVDNHNLHIENKVQSVTNPLSKERLQNIKLNKENIQQQISNSNASEEDQPEEFPNETSIMNVSTPVLNPTKKLKTVVRR